MADSGIPRRDQRLLGQGTTRRCALFLVLVVTLVVGLSLRAVRVLVSSGQDPELLAMADLHQRVLPPLSVLRLVELARPYEAEILDNAEPIAVTAGALTLLIATALHLCGPALRKRSLVRVADPRLHDMLVQLTLRAGVKPIPAFYFDPQRASAGAVTFGSAGSYHVALDNGLVTMAEDARCSIRGRQTEEGAVFAAVVLHELAHLRNHDVELGSAVRALWMAFTATAVLPYATLLAWLWGSELSGTRYSWSGSGPQWSPLGEGALTAVLVVMVYAAYTDILRHRELCADLDAVDWGADPDAWNAVAEKQAGRRMGPEWKLEHWQSEPDDGWISVFGWARKSRPLRSATRPWHTHPGWWWRIRALKRPAHPTGPNGTWTQAVILTGTVMALMHMLFNELAHAAGLAFLTSSLFYAGLVLCVSLGRPLTVHPAHTFHPQPRAFGGESRGRARRAALLGGCFLLLLVLDPLGGVFGAFG
ncbi:M48 family metalloprotease [Streptomyces sp. P9(2023)]|uniref:M48 family metalloprotease n=1 Tax=Streptomyces sp. P9(2023) TaxID=3064394 RepID=UPI0028F460C9|nr:M48 family metalloprotease [Streptomyces sp. P9(2023)]MDT9692010.1 M48 family metalloprotease [Streptomyces sp. P9(2023)]